MSNFIVIVDDEEDIAELVSINLKKNNFSVKKYFTGSGLLNGLENHKPDLIILDLMLPDFDGIEICKKLKQNENYSDIPIIMLTAKADEIDKIIGLEIGADDYITKPFSPRELVARVKAVLRRQNRTSKKNKDNEIVIKNILKIIPEKHEIRVEDELIELTATEFKILMILIEKTGWVFSREQLIEKLWNGEKFVSSRTIDVHINHLRKKLKKAGKFIKNNRGMGYKFDIT